ncbi:MAG: peroxiredoxin family protein [Acidiferrobacterales bacterium]
MVMKNMKTLKHQIISVLVLLGFFLAAPTYAAGLTDFSGQSKEISDFTGGGKWRIVMIWASDCHVCNQEAHTYVKFNQEHKDKDAQMLGISMDGKEKLKEAEAFIKRHQLNFPNLIGEPVDVAMKYMQLTGAEWVGTPTFLIYGPQGELLAKQEGAVPVDLIENFIKSHASAKSTKSDKSS